MQASWCSFIDWSHTAVRTGVVTGVNYWPGWGTDKLLNQGVDGFSNYSLWGYGDQNWANYCPYPGWPA